MPLLNLPAMKHSHFFKIRLTVLILWGLVSVWCIELFKLIIMEQITQDDLRYLQSLIDALQYEISKGKDNGGFVCGGYITEKASKILKVVNPKIVIK